MTNAYSTIGYVLLGLLVLAIGFIPVYIAAYKSNENAEQIYKATPIAILGLGIVGLGLSILFQSLKVNTEVWALIILIVVEVVRLAAWIYLMIKAVKDEELPIF